MEENINDYLVAQKEVRALLEKMGVGIEQAQDVSLLFERYAAMDIQLETLREKQFQGDAYEIARELQVATPKKVDQIAAYLRRFAEHIVARTVERLDESFASILKEQDKLAEFVDSLPSMQDVEEN